MVGKYPEQVNQKEVLILIYECGPVRLGGNPHINRGIAQAPLMF